MSVIYRTPLPQVWDLTLGRFMRYYRRLTTMAKVTNPFMGGDDEKDKPAGKRDGITINGSEIQTPEQLLQTMLAMGATGPRPPVNGTK